MKYQLAIQTLKTKIIITEDKLIQYNSIIAGKDYTKNVVLEAIIEMHKERIKQLYDAIEILKKQ